MVSIVLSQSASTSTTLRSRISRRGRVVLGIQLDILQR